MTPGTAGHPPGLELLAPAGSIDKLETAYAYGADAAYLGLAGFSLRSHAECSIDLDPAALAAIKGSRKLYGALNIYFHDADIDRLEAGMERIGELPLDALIVSDLGIVPILRRRLPQFELHLSTQANCLNSSAARAYYDMGFTRIVPAREMSIDDVARVKDAVPEVEIEVFVHGAMCLAYSGRCLLSAWEAGRSANKGDCAHSCRWNYRVAVEEEQRPGSYYPVEEGDGFSTILSPKDLCMIDHIERLHDAGVDALKIEGRMKSDYYVAVVTRAYRKEIDRLRAGASRASVDAFVRDLYTVSHREFSTGFYFGDPRETAPAAATYHQRYRYVARVGERISDNGFRVDVKNAIAADERLDAIGPDVPSIALGGCEFRDGDGAVTTRLTHHDRGSIHTDAPIEPGFLIRRPAPEP